MAILASWSGGALPTVVGDVTLASGVSPVDASATPSLQVASSAAAAFARFEFGSVTSVAARAYFRTPAAWASSACNILVLRVSASSIATGLAVSGTGAPGQLRLIGAGGTIFAQSPNNTLQPSTDYEVSIQLLSTGQLEARLRLVGSPDPAWSAVIDPATSGLAGTSVFRAEFGRPNSTPALGPFWLDDIVVTDGDFPAPSALEYIEEPEEPEEPEEFPLSWTTGAAPSNFGGGVAVVAGGLTPDVSGVLRFEQAEGSACYTEWDLLGREQGLLCIRAYFCTPSSWASSAWGLINLRPTPSTLVASLTISGAGQPGQIRLSGTGGANLAVAPNNTIALSSWYRLEMQYDAAQTRARVAVFAFNSVEPMWESGWVANAGFSELIRLVQIGRVTLSPVVAPFGVDEIIIDNTAKPDWIGRSANEAGYEFTYWDGSTQTPVTLTYWNGSAETPLDF